MTVPGPEAMQSRLHLEPGVDGAIRKHGRDTYPDECCGALIGREGIVHSTFALPNVTDEGPRRRFRVSTDDYRASERRAADSGGELLGFYHSHPDHPARPSQYDLDHAWPCFSYIIVAVRGGVPGDMTSWRLKDDRSAFEQETLTYGEHHSHSDPAPAVHRQEGVG